MKNLKLDTFHMRMRRQRNWAAGSRVPAWLGVAALAATGASVWFGLRSRRAAAEAGGLGFNTTERPGGEPAVEPNPAVEKEPLATLAGVV